MHASDCYFLLFILIVLIGCLHFRFICIKAAQEEEEEGEQ